ncbi:PhnD/SsuA/transferrin family substrate-binding protein [Halobacillus naozhouensis]|uniref:PhnD/SsuA/transferrin family substrate-binding protein n=1 Tax=Halobacillus naozhouensis TaxID=554880 RepID=A0ABY8J1L9_9BACI|nr:PhnD/SsuA/transferrin family substrate-binding protein [Halobacillus naozhouensis]WFT76398.1 PhnD/SsuA/transferrin family substrate-binding protein [Halobacillus naozhouensis]
MKKKLTLLALLVVITVLTTACSMKSAGGNTKADDVIDIVWYPNESGSDMKSSRDEIANVIEEATGKKVEHHLTTDYAIAIETMVNNNADLAFMGAQGYIEAHKSNESIKPLVVPTGPSGTLEDAVYHSWLAVHVDEQDKFKVKGEFSLDTLEGKKMSFVSNSSTSGFKVPAAGILDHFSQQEKYADLTEMELMKGGSLFSKVLFGNSHQGSAVNLLKGNADVAAFCDTCVENYVEIVEGKENTVGSVYQVQNDAAEPFNQVTGKKFTLMSVTPVLNAPFVANVDVLGQEDFDKLQKVLTSDEVANNEEIFVPEDSGKSGLFFKTGKERFATIKDSWFDPIRKLSK